MLGPLHCQAKYSGIIAIVAKKYLITCRQNSRQQFEDQVETFVLERGAVLMTADKVTKALSCAAPSRGRWKWRRTSLVLKTTKARRHARGVLFWTSAPNSSSTIRTCAWPRTTVSRWFAATSMPWKWSLRPTRMCWYCGVVHHWAEAEQVFKVSSALLLEGVSSHGPEETQSQTRLRQIDSLLAQSVFWPVLIYCP